MSELKDAAQIISDAINGPNWYIIGAGVLSAIATVVLTWISGFTIARWSTKNQRIGVEISIASALHEEILSINNLLYDLEQHPSPYSDVNIQVLKDSRLLSIYLGAADNIGVLHKNSTLHIVRFYLAIIRLKNSKQIKVGSDACHFLERSELASLRRMSEKALASLQTHYGLNELEEEGSFGRPWYMRQKHGER